MPDSRIPWESEDFDQEDWPYLEDYEGPDDLSDWLWSEVSKEGEASLWKPRDPNPWFTPTIDERREYSASLLEEAERLSRGSYLRRGGVREGEQIAGVFGPSGLYSKFRGTYQVSQSSLGWLGSWLSGAARGTREAFTPKTRVTYGVWGRDVLETPFPVLGGAIITPSILLKKEEVEGRRGDYTVKADLRSGRSAVREIMEESWNVGRDVATSAYKSRMSLREALEMLVAGDKSKLPSARSVMARAESAALNVVRRKTDPYPKQDFGERWSQPRGQRMAIAGSAAIQFEGEYPASPMELSAALASIGYFTRKIRPSWDPYHPNRPHWQAYRFETLKEIGWIQDTPTSMVTGTKKPSRRRQLGVQDLVAPILKEGAPVKIGKGRVTGDRMAYTTAVFVENYPYAEGTGVSAELFEGFRDFRPEILERPRHSLVSGRWRAEIDKSRRFTEPGRDLWIGKQYFGDPHSGSGAVTEADLELVPGIPGARQRIWGWRDIQGDPRYDETRTQLLIERVIPFESGRAKVMHYGLKALDMISPTIMAQHQRRVSRAVKSGQLPGDVGVPGMVLPQSKDWVQTAYGMYDVMSNEELRSALAEGGMDPAGIERAISTPRERQPEYWQKHGPSIIDALYKFKEARRFTYTETHRVPLERLSAFLEAENVVGGEAGVKILEMGEGIYKTKFAQFQAQYAARVLPTPVGIRLEEAGKDPALSPEEIMQFRMIYPRTAQNLMKGGPSSRLWAIPVAQGEGTRPKGTVDYRSIPWSKVYLDEQGGLADIVSRRQLIENLEREMLGMGLTARKAPAIEGPGGILFPHPSDILTKSALSLTGDERSSIVHSYGTAIEEIMSAADPEDMTKEEMAKLETFRERFEVFTSGHNVRRRALGAQLGKAIESAYVGHIGIPDDIIVVGERALWSLVGADPSSKEAKQRVSEVKSILKAAKEPMYVLGTRRPVNDIFAQVGVPLRVITEDMAKKMYGVDIRNLGGSFAVSPTVAARWRGDFDADRAVNAAVSELIRSKGGPYLKTESDVLNVAQGQTILAGQLEALRSHSTEAYEEWMSRQPNVIRRAVEMGLAGSRGIAPTIAMSRAVHGIDVPWNEAAKWAKELRFHDDPTTPHPGAPRPWKWYQENTRFTFDELGQEFGRELKGGWYMGRTYNRWLRGMSWMASNMDELRAALAMGSSTYQRAIDKTPQEFTPGEVNLLNLTESMGEGFAMFDKFGTGSKRTLLHGPRGFLTAIAQGVFESRIPQSVKGRLFSRDPAIAALVESGADPGTIVESISDPLKGPSGLMKAPAEFLGDPERAGILPQVIQAFHYSKRSTSQITGPGIERYRQLGMSIRGGIEVLSKSRPGGLHPETATKYMRGMIGLPSVSWWKQVNARRMGFNRRFFLSREEIREDLENRGIMVGLNERRPGFANPSLQGEEFLAYISPKEAGVLEGLRQMPVASAQKVASIIGKPPRYTPGNAGLPSFQTGPGGWDDWTAMLSDEQNDEIDRMARMGATDNEIEAKILGYLEQAQEPPPKVATPQKERVSPPLERPADVLFDPRSATTTLGVWTYEKGREAWVPTGQHPIAQHPDIETVQRVYSEYGGQPALEKEKQRIRSHLESTGKSPGSTIFRDIARTLMSAGVGEAGMETWRAISQRHGVGFRYNLETGRFSHQYGSAVEVPGTRLEGEAQYGYKPPKELASYEPQDFIRVAPTPLLRGLAETFERVKGLTPDMRMERRRKMERYWNLADAARSRPGGEEDYARYRQLYEQEKELLARYGDVPPEMAQELMAGMANEFWRMFTDEEKGGGVRVSTTPQNQNALFNALGILMRGMGHELGAGVKLTSYGVGTGRETHLIQRDQRGLYGEIRNLMFDVTERALGEGRVTPEVVRGMQGIAAQGASVEMLNRLARVTQIDPTAITTPEEALKGIFDIFRLEQDIGGEDTPEKVQQKRDDLIAVMGDLQAALEDNTEVSKGQTQAIRDQVEARQQRIVSDPRYIAAEEELKNIAFGAIRAPQRGILDRLLGRQPVAGPTLTGSQRQMLTGLARLREGELGIGTGDIEQVVRDADTEEILQAIGGGRGRGRGRGGAINRLLGRDPSTPGFGMGTVENLFTELTLGWTAFRMRMSWNLLTGQQRAWMGDFMGQEAAAVGAALAGGAQPGFAGPASQYLSAQAALANTRATLGQGVAQVYTPFMTGLSNLSLTPGVGSGAALLGTTLGVGAVSALATHMLGAAIPAIGALTAPIGLAAMGITGGALTNQYLTGEAQQWVRYDPGSYSQRWRRQARIGEVGGALPGGAPDWALRTFGAITGALGIPEDFVWTPQAQERIAIEERRWRPGYLAYDVDRLRSLAEEISDKRVPSTSTLQLMQSMFGIAGLSAEQVYSAGERGTSFGTSGQQNADNFRRLMEQYVSYLEAGASPEELITSQLRTLGYTGIPIGTPEATQFLLDFARTVPAQERPAYEGYYEYLSPMKGLTGRPITMDQAERVGRLVEMYKQRGELITEERAAGIVTSEEGLGPFISGLGVTPESPTARLAGQFFAGLEPGEQGVAEQLVGLLGQSLARAGVPAMERIGFVSGLARKAGDQVFEIANLAVAAESVAIETRGDMKDLFNEAIRAFGPTGGELIDSSRNMADYRFMVGVLKGIGGIAPATMVPGFGAASEFELPFAAARGRYQMALPMTGALLNQMYPEGYTQYQAGAVATQLARDIPINLISQSLLGATGMGGPGVAMGFPAGSQAAANANIAAMATGMGSQEMQAYASAISPDWFQYAQGAGGWLGNFAGQQFRRFYAGDMTRWQYSTAMQMVTNSTPYGYSARRGFGPGSLTDVYGRPAGYDQVFAAQQAAGWASVNLTAASIPIDHARWQREMATNRMMWGSGAYVPTDQVASTISETGQVGGGLQIGQSVIGLAQQERAIRRQMWQENLQYQLQGLEFARKGLEIAEKQLALSRQIYEAQYEYRTEEREAQRGFQLRQREWRAEDFAMGVQRLGITQQWEMEDLQRARRYATGRQRVEIERRIQRTQITQGWEQGDLQRGRERELETYRYEDQRYERMKDHEQEMHRLQQRRFALEAERLALQDQQIAAQQAHLMAQAAMQNQMWLLDEEQNKKKHEDMQAFMEEEEELEKLRVAAREAQLEFQKTQLANAEALKDAEEKWMDEIIKFDDYLKALADWIIERANLIKVLIGRSDAPPIVQEPEGGGLQKAMGVPVIDGVPYRMSDALPMGSLGVSRDLDNAQRAAQPVVVNFQLDGQTIMSFAVTPERLRPVVKEIARRESWR